MSQLHKRFTSDQVQVLLERYLRNEIERKYVQEILGIKERRFFALLSQYRTNPHDFSIQYQRTSPPRIPEDLENNMLRELSIEKGIIQNKEVPLTCYNYSYIAGTKALGTDPMQRTVTSSSSSRLTVACQARYKPSPC